MNRDETVALFLQGREAWNAWAEKMLAERKALEAAGAGERKADYVWAGAKTPETRRLDERGDSGFLPLLFRNEARICLSGSW